jgi:hypothetical protein
MLPLFVLLLALVIWIFWLLFEGVTRWQPTKRPIRWLSNRFDFKNLESTRLIKFVVLAILLLGLSFFTYKEFNFLEELFFNKGDKVGLKEKYLEYGIGGDLITTALGALFVGMIAMVTFEVLKRRDDERNREEKLTNSAKCVERLTQSGLYDESLSISKSLFEDIFKEFNQEKELDVSNPICTAYLSNLEVYGQCLLGPHEDIDNELKNLVAVEKIYEELFQTLYQSIDLPRKKADTWEKRTERFTKEFILSKENDEKYTVQTFLRHARFLNSWADVLIRLSRYVKRGRYLAQAETVLGWAREGVFKLVDNSGKNGKNVKSCLDFILEQIRYHRLCGDLIHEQNHIEYHKTLDSYRKKHENAEYEYRMALALVSLAPSFSIEIMVKNNMLPLWLEYQPILSTSSPLSRDRNNGSEADSKPENSLRRNLRKSVENACCKKNDYYLWSDIERCKCKKNRIDDIRKRVDITDIKPKYKTNIKPEMEPEYARRPNMDEFTDDIFIETAKIYLRLAKNSIRYIAEANEKEWNLSSPIESQQIQDRANQPAKEEEKNDEYQYSNNLINRSLGRARSLIDLELSWKHCIDFYDTLGVYLTEKGRYEERHEHWKQAEDLYKTASRVHEMTRVHLADCSMKAVEIAEGPDMPTESEWYNNVNNLLYLSNLIDFGRARQHLYQLYHNDKDKHNDKEQQSIFDVARRTLLQALKISTRTNNFICRAEAHLALAELYIVDPVHWGDAIIAFRSCIETFSKHEYYAYHDKVCTQLADFYSRHHDDFDNVQKAIFIKSFNLCTGYDQRECRRFKDSNLDFNKHIYKLIDRAPDECPEITHRRCSPKYWRDFPDENNNP